MRKVIFVFALCLFIQSCKDKGNVESGFGLQRVKEGACEYIVYKKPQGVSVVHAGDCNNPIHSPSLKKIKEGMYIDTSIYKIN